jgi:hypothetical protein
MKKWVYESGETVKHFDTEDEAQAWFDANDPEGVAFLMDIDDKKAREREVPPRAR